MGFKRARTLVMPAFGVIKGGRLDGWRFLFLRFRVASVDDGLELQVLARCSAPNWPFPCDIPLNHTHFMQLRPVSGERAKRLPAVPLIERAFKDAGMECPAWVHEPRATVRARVKRTTKARTATC